MLMFDYFEIVFYISLNKKWPLSDLRMVKSLLVLYCQADIQSCSLLVVGGNHIPERLELTPKLILSISRLKKTDM